MPEQDTFLQLFAAARQDLQWLEDIPVSPFIKGSYMPFMDISLSETKNNLLTQVPTYSLNTSVMNNLQQVEYRFFAHNNSLYVQFNKHKQDYRYSNPFRTQIAAYEQHFIECKALISYYQNRLDICVARNICVEQHDSMRKRIAHLTSVYHSLQQQFIEILEQQTSYENSLCLKIADLKPYKALFPHDQRMVIPYSFKKTMPPFYIASKEEYTPYQHGYFSEAEQVLTQKTLEKNFPQFLWVCVDKYEGLNPILVFNKSDGKFFSSSIVLAEARFWEAHTVYTGIIFNKDRFPDRVLNQELFVATLLHEVLHFFGFNHPFQNAEFTCYTAKVFHLNEMNSITFLSALGYNHYSQYRHLSISPITLTTFRQVYGTYDPYKEGVQFVFLETNEISKIKQTFSSTVAVEYVVLNEFHITCLDNPGDDATILDFSRLFVKKANVSYLPGIKLQLVPGGYIDYDDVYEKVNPTSKSHLRAKLSISHQTRNVQRIYLTPLSDEVYISEHYQNVELLCLGGNDTITMAAQGHNTIYIGEPQIYLEVKLLPRTHCTIIYENQPITNNDIWLAREATDLLIDYNNKKICLKDYFNPSNLSKADVQIGAIILPKISQECFATKAYLPLSQAF